MIKKKKRFDGETIRAEAFIYYNIKITRSSLIQQIGCLFENHDEI